ncbi:ArdC family protein [Bacillaceae bacterium CLA-AA-H227]|uniref:DUF1738 domain-containing protein n=2 Tax=Robertmurraya TaxID=2837507 RepID=A0A4U1D0E1_9BACI|nr:ArdC family protein [Robertmurraya kyonggiensis]TKC15123.1 DUF1738 domain-containing protein [Robertmurraya kyonggiensis]
MTFTKTKENIQEKVKEAFKLIEEGVKSITSSDRYQEFLKFSSRFYNYSINNQILIWVQKPNATFVAGFQTWKKMGRPVKKGEKGIRILAPVQVSVNKVNEDGEEEVIKFNRYQMISVFDISQTKGEVPVPSLHEFVKEVEGETELYSMIREISPFPVEELDDCKGADGYISLKTKEIKILSSNSTAHKLLTLIHEMAHGLLHSDRKNKPSRTVMEIEAESVGFIVCHALGIDTSVNSLGYLASYGGKATMNFVEDSKERINLTAKKILSDFEKTYLPKEDNTQ